MPASFTKQPYEAFGIEGDFVNVLDTGETIVLGSSSVTAVDNADNDKSSVVLNQATVAVADLTKLRVQCQAGVESESPYKVTFRILTSDSNKYEIDVNMKVKEI